MKENIFDTLSIIISSALTISQTNELFRLISFMLTILTSLLVLISKIVVWYKSAHADGKITADEIGDIVDTVQKTVDEIRVTVDDHTDPVDTVQKTVDEIRVTVDDHTDPVE